MSPNERPRSVREVFGEGASTTDRGSPFDTVANIVRLPDGRWATQNARDISDLTQRDIIEILSAFGAWASAQLDLKAARDPEALGGIDEGGDSQDQPSA